MSTSAAGHCYDVYGLTLRSEFELPLRPRTSELADVEIETAPADHFAGALGGTAVPDEFRAYVRLPDGSSYARWMTVGEYLVSADGRHITCRRFDGATDASFHVYLLGQALAIGLVKLGLEPLHGTAVVIGEHAVAFLGGSHVGKSTLAASFAAAGHRLLTDDILVLRPAPPADRMFAFPGPPRIKLYSDIARKLLPGLASGGSMNGQVPKLILSLERDACCSSPTPIAALYILGDARQAFHGQACRVESLSPNQRFVHLVAHTLNHAVIDAHRLKRHFKTAVTLVDTIPVRRLVYPRDLGKLSEVREAVYADVAKLLSEVT